MSNADVVVGTSGPGLAYAVLDLNANVMNNTNQSTRLSLESFPAEFRSIRAQSSKDVKLGIADMLSVTIFEASSGGLFIPSEAGARAGNFVQVPNQQVDARGNIAVPYAGIVHVAGMSATDAAALIARKLSDRAIEPQVIISIAERRGNDISVLGEVYQPIRVPLDPGGLRVLTAIARAGGPRNQSYESLVTIQRGGRTAQAVLSTIVADPRQNVLLTPGDVVYISKDPKIFLAFGSTPSPGSVGGINNRRFSFDNDNMTLSEAIAKAGGLDDVRADTAAIYLLRMEHRETLKNVGVDISRFPAEMIPTIYRINWNKSDGMFVASNFFMRNRDIIYVAEHPVADISKLSAAFRTFTVPAADVSSLAGR